MAIDYQLLGKRVLQLRKERAGRRNVWQKNQVFQTIMFPILKTATPFPVWKH